MSEPEIARRCQTCGAAVRGAARFCPQCGQPMGDEPAPGATRARAQPRAKSALVDQAERVANSLSGRLSVPEPEASAPADENEDVLSLDAEPAATARAAESSVRSDDQEPDAPSSVGEPVARTDEPVVGRAPGEGDGARASVEVSKSDERGAPTVSMKDSRAVVPAPDGGEARAVLAGDGRGAGRVRRATAAVGAGLGESVRPRVEKLREASVVVFDEAAEDPGMRFVVIAALLFVVALLILLFSFVLR